MTPPAKPLSDDIAFAIILVGSVVVAALLRICPISRRADAAALTGALAILVACGRANALHPLSAILLAIAVLCLAPPRHRSAAAFVVAFGHLAFVRLLPSPPGGPTNAAMLLLTLRLSAVDEATSVAELVRYACCFQGLFTGPHLSHAEWDAAMRQPQPLPPARRVGRALLAAVGALAFWRLIASQLPYKLVPGDASAEVLAKAPAWLAPLLPRLAADPATDGPLSFALRLLFFYASSYQFRWRFYACWQVMELSGLLLGVSDVSNADVLAVEAGWGGQPFQPAMLDKVRWLRVHYPRLEHIMLDGGINAETARAAAAAGANVLVAGSYLFGSDDMASSFDALEDALLTHGE